jgi:tryptophan synthase alpha chain
MKNMSNRLDKLLDANENILTLYLTSGYPDKNTSNDIAKILLKSNIDILEIGIPFSDPIADGPTIQNTSFKAINSINEPIINFTFNTIKTLRKIDNQKPIILMSYLNLIYQYGIEDFAKQAKMNGADAVVIPDLPFDESHNIKSVLDNNNIHLIYMVTPTSSDETISKISKNAKGFIYYVSSTGVTGSRETISDKNFDNINKIKKISKIPILIGFGISTKDHIKQIKPWANGVIIASALINEINSVFEDNEYSEEKLNNYINNFVNNLRD